MKQRILFALAAKFLLLVPLAATLHAADAPLSFADAKPQRYELTARASQLDPRARASGD